MDNLLLILISPKIDRDILIKDLDTAGKIDTWFYSFPNSVFVKTMMNSREMSKYIDEKYGQHVNFVTSVEDDYFGRMNTDQWKYFKKVKY